MPSNMTDSCPNGITPPLQHNVGSYRKHIPKLPSEIIHLDKLVSLDISNNQFLSLPVELRQMKGLKFVAIGGNPCADSEGR
jgi:Leucine-rich repeat (LRR) protein